MLKRDLIVFTRHLIKKDFPDPAVPPTTILNEMLGSIAVIIDGLHNNIKSHLLTFIQEVDVHIWEFKIFICSVVTEDIIQPGFAKI
jgi:hypothetical protein